MTEYELLEELIKELTYPTIEPHEFTVQELSKKAGISCQLMNDTVQGKLDAGIMKRRKVRNRSGRITYAYSKV